MLRLKNTEKVYYIVTNFLIYFLIISTQTALFHIWVALKNPIRMILNNL